MPTYRAGETVYLRARITEDCSDVFTRKAVAPVVIEDFPAGSFVSRAFAPFTEVARQSDIARLFEPVTIDPATVRR